ncbi:DUF2478 domain-containing protein [Bradyrhizobium macuxiense]|uniref:DUF2478 domain-containing protein n=1 Tax=Bradyrhizobium macuxiense TaxID=1755647 RepID=UPI0009EA5006|nr:DUF2478 domain-containing protein [Bradyrhizobium macuxiense]
MFDAECDLAAVVYGADQNPDSVLHDFATDLSAQGHRVVGMVQVGQCADSSLHGVLVHNGEKLSLAKNLAPVEHGCRLDLERLQNAAARIAGALEAGADLMIINRFGRRECAGKGLVYLIERARDADIPVVVAVAGHRFTDWIEFANGMSVKLACDRAALGGWWRGLSNGRPPLHERPTICEILK